MTAILVVGLEPQPAAAPSHTHSADAPPQFIELLSLETVRFARLRAVACGDGHAARTPFSALVPTTTSAALGLSWRNGARAWGAANRQEAAVVQGVARHAMFPNKGGNLRTRPVEERMDFDQIVYVVDRGKRYAGAFVRLVRAKPGDPRGGARKSPAKQLDFTDGTAGLPPLDRIEEPIDALAGDQQFNAYVIGIERRNSAAVLPFRLSPELIGLRKQTSRIERHHLDLKGLPEYRAARSPGPQARSSW